MFYVKIANTKGLYSDTIRIVHSIAKPGEHRATEHFDCCMLLSHCLLDHHGSLSLSSLSSQAAPVALAMSSGQNLTMILTLILMHLLALCVDALLAKVPELCILARLLPVLCALARLRVQVVAKCMCHTVTRKTLLMPVRALP